MKKEVLNECVNEDMMDAVLEVQDDVDDYEYYRFNPDGSNWQIVYHSGSSLYQGGYDDCCHCNVVNGVLYCGNRVGLYKSTGTNQWELIAAGDYSDICIVGDWIYSRKHGNGYRDVKSTISRTRIDGSCVEVMG